VFFGAHPNPNSLGLELLLGIIYRPKTFPQSSHRYTGGHETGNSISHTAKPGDQCGNANALQHGWPLFGIAGNAKFPLLF
jgi:hypothetical protein